jgi:hypothetical protein
MPVTPSTHPVREPRSDDTDDRPGSGRPPPSGGRRISADTRQDHDGPGFAKTLAQGQPDRFKILREGVEATARELRDAPGTLF